MLAQFEEAVSAQLNLVIDRTGKVVKIEQGDLTAELLSGIRRRKSKKRLSGLRVISISNSQQLTFAQENLVLKFRLDNLVKVSLKSDSVVLILPKITGGRLVETEERKLTIKQAIRFDQAVAVSRLEEKLTELDNYRVEKDRERAILVGKDEEDLEELKGLATTAGVKVVARRLQKQERNNPAYYIGTGKLEELKGVVFSQQSNLVIFDDELTPAQHSNLEEKLAVQVVDRTELILDIFAQHAHTKEGKIQVELAQLEYLLPRLTGQGEQLSRLGGGIGTRGPGESKLEIDRRKIRKRIHRLKEQLTEVRQNRAVQRQGRKNPLITLVGYTNVGKSTLMNLLTAADVKVEDELFATLDSTLRQAKLPLGRQVIFSDTVGFIKKLPHQLVAAFQATLEEVQQADLLLHVVDSSQAQLEERMAIVHDVLEGLGVLNKEIITVFNKADLVTADYLELLQQDYPRSVAICALTGEGKDRLLEQISEIIARDMVTVDLELPYEAGKWIDQLYRSGQVLEESYVANKIKVTANISKRLAQRLQDYQV
ncbi:GTPase HflX [Natroniella acetigena]|uniref:GTPase HflX n=1 Tax=Natroniella acetigena TaxID=52004 RepID=UPI00200B5AE7|nr:GTPase HflX [Natroniella acetigena]MCK8828311.1 GTPase HflX [Natroniella acetigena]